MSLTQAESEKTIQRQTLPPQEEQMSNQATKGTWVRIHNTVLKVGERAPQIPEETKAVPLEMWINGFLNNDSAKIGDQISITTLAGLTREGVMVEVMPAHRVDYGQPQPELLTIGQELRAILREGAN